MKKKFDLAFGIGAACSCTQVLRLAKLQFLSFPFDWLYGATIEYRTDILCSDFVDIIKQSDLAYVERHSYNGKDIYKNEVSGIVFNHDFPEGVELAESYPDVARKYDRRSRRLISLIENSRRILVVCVCVPNSSLDVYMQSETWEEMADRVIEKLKKRFGNRHHFNLVIFECEKGTSFANRKVLQYKDAVKICFDYKHKDPDKPSHAIMEHDIVNLLRSEFKVRDYRTPQERSRDKSRNRKNYGVGKFGLVSKICYKMRKHIKKNWGGLI